MERLSSVYQEMILDVYESNEQRIREKEIDVDDETHKHRKIEWDGARYYGARYSPALWRARE